VNRKPDSNEASLVSWKKGERKGLISSGFHLPYNPKLIVYARLLRKYLTEPEKKLWYGYLRTYKFKFYRQRPIDHYIVDFYCPKLKLVIEIDGEGHYTEVGKQNDEQKTAILNGYGLKVLRIVNQEVLDNFKSVCVKIDTLCNQT
jgi:very-short-patch-repair endonuclease